MKVEIINKDGNAWTFKTIKNALPHIKKYKREDYTIINNIRIYDDRDDFEN